MRYCSGCGGNVLDNTLFCPSCGSTVSKEESKPTAISDFPNTVLTPPAPIEVSGYGPAKESPLQHSSNAHHEDEDEDEDSEKIPLIPLPQPLTVGQVPANTVPVVEGMPSVHGVPMVQGTPQAPTAPAAGQPGAFHAPSSAPFQATHVLAPQQGYPRQLPVTPKKLSTTSPHKSYIQGRRRKGLHHPLVKPMLIAVTTCVLLTTFSAILLPLFPPALALQGSNSTLIGTRQVFSGGTLQVHGDRFIPLGRVNLTLDKGIPIFAQDPTGANSHGNQLSSAVGPIAVGIDGTFTVTIEVHEQWALGEHALHATEQFTGRSTTLPFKILPRVAKLQVSSNSLDFGQLQMGSKASLSLVLSNAGQQPLSWQATTGGTAWLKLQGGFGKIEPGALQQVLDVTADVTHLTPGVYSSTLRITSNGGDVPVPVEVEVVKHKNPHVTLQVTPNNLSFGSIAIGQQSTLVVTVANPGTQSLTWNATAGNTSWLSLSTTTGTITAGGPPQTINVTADTTHLAPQSYTTALQINSNGGSATLAVTLVVTTGTQTSSVAGAPKRGPASIPTTTPTSPSTLVVSPAVFNANTNCAYSTSHGWSCDATISSLRSAKSSLNWSVTASGLNNVIFQPAKGILSPGQTMHVTIHVPNTACPVNGDFAFTGPHNTAHVAWNCKRSNLTVTPANLHFGTLQIGQQATQTVTVGNSSGQALNWTATKGRVSWLTLSNSGSTLAPGATTTMNVTANTTGVTPGLYSASVNINSNAGNLSVVITLTVTSPPASLGVKPTSLSFNAVQGTTTTSSQTLTVTNTGGQPLTWTAQTDGTRWLTLTNAGSTLAPGATATVTLTVDPTGLAAQVYSASVSINAPGGKVQVAVVLTVTPAPTTTYTATVTIPVPPASTYAGSAGGDGWAVAMTPTAVYNVFHHNGALQVACHLQTDASPCWNPETITDTSGNNFATSGQPGLWLDQASGRLYVYATRTSDATGGVVCIDTTQATSNPDPFCGFTALTAAGDAPLQSGLSGISDPVFIGSNWYAFNYVNGSPTGTQDQLMCFSVTSLSPCASQPYPVDIGNGSVSTLGFPNPSIASFASQIEIPLAFADGSKEMTCFDSSSGQKCAGAWPVSTTALSYPETSNVGSGGGAAFPLLDSTGALTGFCLPIAGDPCFNMSGASVVTPQGLASTVVPNPGWDGTSLVQPPRVYVPQGSFDGGDSVACFDYSKGTSCTNFPRTFSNLSLLYTVNADPQRPTCIWVNSDGGAGQIQNFDAYTGGACGQGPIRVLASSMVVPSQLCTPSSYTALRVLSPPPTSYTGGSVALEDGDGNPIAGIPDQPLDSSGKVDLSTLNLSTGLGLPEFLITLNGLGTTATSVTVQLTWTGINDPSCVPGT